MPHEDRARTGHTVLQIPVPNLETFVRARTSHYDPSFVSADPAFTHAHITALAPWRPRPAARELTRVAAIARRTESFDFELSRIAAFPNGIVYLAPEPDLRFRDLTAHLVSAFPDCLPYAGEFDVLVPHLTLDHLADDVSIESTRRLLGDVVPARCRADRLDLAWYESGACRVLASWSFTGRPAAMPGN